MDNEIKEALALKWLVDRGARVWFDKQCYAFFDHIGAIGGASWQTTKESVRINIKHNLKGLSELMQELSTEKWLTEKFEL